jgi:hypothetical protein
MVNLDSNQTDCDNKLKDNEYNSCATSKCSKPNYDVHKIYNHSPNNLSYDNCKENNFRILHQNIRGIFHTIDEFLISLLSHTIDKFLISLLSHKIDKFLISLLHNAPHVLCLTEHHLQTVGNVNLGHYTLGAQFCRQTYKQGGVSIYVSNDIQFNTINLDQYNREKDLEICALKIR